MGPRDRERYGEPENGDEEHDDERDADPPRPAEQGNRLEIRNFRGASGL
jgi:hypothetical protein